MPTKTIHDANQINTPAVGDEFPIWQVSSSAQKRITVADVTAYLESALDLSGDYLLRDGSVAMAAALDMGGFAISNVGNVDGVDVSALNTAALKKDGSVAMTGALDMGGFAVTNVGNVDGVDVSAHAASTSNPHSVTAAQVGAVKHDGTVALTGDWDIGASRKIQAERIDARSNLGLKLYEDGGLGVDIVDSTGFVGIGTSSPDGRLTVVRAAAVTANEVITISTGVQSGTVHGVGAGNYLSWRFSDNANPANEVGRITVAEDTATVWGNAMIFSTAAPTTATLTERMRITSGGLVGIGIASPDSLLHVWKASAGTVTAATDTIITIENSTDAAINFLTPNTASAHVYFGDPDDNDVGFFRYNHANNQIIFGTNAAERVSIDGNGRMDPKADGTQDLGNGGTRWREIFATNGTINTSNADDKVSINPSILGLEFIQALNPVSWVWADRDEPALIETRTVKRQKTRKVMRTETVTETAADGKRVRKTIEREVDEPVFESIPLFYVNGKPILEEKKTTVIDSETGEPVEVIEPVQAVEQVPVYEEVEEQIVVRPEVKQTHRRPHFGLIAQEVRRALDRLGIDDFAGYIHDPAHNFYGLRYSEFIAPLIKAVQQLADRLDQLEQTGVKK